MQCVFLPLSPCVLTIEDLGNASHVAREDLSVLRKSGFLNSKYDNSKVIILPTNAQLLFIYIPRLRSCNGR
jgi:hypothetical protein